MFCCRENICRLAPLNLIDDRNCLRKWSCGFIIYLKIYLKKRYTSFVDFFKLGYYFTEPLKIRWGVCSLWVDTDMKASLQVKTKLFWLISVFSCDEVFLLIAAPPSTDHKGSLNSLMRMMQILCYGLHSHQIWAQFNKQRFGTILNSIFAWNKPHWHFLVMRCLKSASIRVITLRYWWIVHTETSHLQM